MIMTCTALNLRHDIDVCCRLAGHIAPTLKQEVSYMFQISLA